MKNDHEAENIELTKTYERLLDGNRKWSMSRKFDDALFYKRLAERQTPEYLWIGCSDSRVPANEITGTESGQMFVHRNIANMVVHTDLSLLSVLEYAVQVLHVKHIIVCGHYGCGGVRAAMGNDSIGHVDAWLRNIKEVYQKHRIELEAIDDMDEREDRLTELNVIEQVDNLSKTVIVQQAWKKRALQIHGWVYGVNNGIITDLDACHHNIDEVEPVFRYKL